MKDLPAPARMFVGAVLAAGTVALVVFFPRAIENPVLFAFLLLCSSLASALKVNLPLASSGSTMSVSYAVNFLALLLFDPHVSTLIALAAALCQLNQKRRTQMYRQVFSLASFVITVEGAGLVYHLLGGVTPPARMATVVRSLLAVSNRSVSRGSRTKARTTRTPVICSRSRRLTSSIRDCMSRKLGTIREMMNPSSTASTGTVAAISHDSPRSSRIAMMIPPTIMIGAITISVHDISTSICTC